MNSLKQKYLDRIRSDSAYPAFRSVVNTFTLLLYVSGGLIVLTSIITGFSASSPPTAIGGIIVGLFLAVLGKVTREVSLMMVDVADSITDLNSRNEGSDHLNKAVQASDLGRIAQASEAAAEHSQANADLLRQLIRAYGHEPEA